MNASRRVQRVARNAVLGSSAAIVAAVSLASAHVALATALPGGIYVERVGGTSAFGAGAGVGDATTGLPVFVDGIATSGSPTAPQLTLSLATAAATGVRPLTDVAQAGGTTPAAVNIMQLSPNGRYLTIAGWDVAAGSNTTGGNKSVGVIDTTDSSVSTQFGFSSTAQPRSIVTVDKTGYWFVGSANGIRYITPNANPDSPGTITTISATNVNQRGGSIYGGQLFLVGSSSVATNGNTSSGQPGIAFMGTGVPTTATQTQTYIMNTAGGTNTSNNPEQFVMLDLNPSVSYVNGTVDTKLDTTYVGVDGGVQKWTYNGSAWTLAYTLGGGISSDPASKLKGGVLGVTYAGKDGSGNPILYATTAGNSTVTTSAEGNAILRLVDSGSGSDSWSTVLTSPDNSWFRGLQYVAPLVVHNPGDANNDGIVDQLDLNVVNGNWQVATNVWESGDLNGDGLVDQLDLNLVNANWQATYAHAPEGIVAIPEPASFSLLAVGAIPLLRRRRRRA